MTGDPPRAWHQWSSTLSQRWSASMVGLITAALLASCGGSTAPVGINHDAVAIGTVTAAIFFGGGPAVPRGHHRSALGGTVTIFDSAGKLYTRLRVQTGHHFGVAVSPGQYALKAGYELRPRSGCPPAHILVRTGRTTHANVYVNCSIP